MTSSEPSRFIDEINPKFLHFETPPRGLGRSLKSGRPLGVGFGGTTGGLNKNLDSVSQRPAASVQNLKPISQANTGKTDLLELKVGYNVMHDRFGKGKITKIEGQGADKKATIFFPHHGAKNILLRFANLVVVD